MEPLGRTEQDVCSSSAGDAWLKRYHCDDPLLPGCSFNEPRSAVMYFRLVAREPQALRLYFPEDRVYGGDATSAVPSFWQNLLDFHE